MHCTLLKTHPAGGLLVHVRYTSHFTELQVIEMGLILQLEYPVWTRILQVRHTFLCFWGVDFVVRQSASDGLIIGVRNIIC